MKNNETHIRIRVSVLTKREDGKICFVRHLKNGKRYWLLPGGGQDAFEKASETAARELQEELRISCKDFRLIFIREAMSKSDNRHIQFMVFEGIKHDFTNIQTGIDKRVEGYDFFDVEEIKSKTIYPAMKEDIIKFANNEPIELFKTLEWI